MSAKTRIIFVDDDPFILQAQRRMLWDIEEWETEFVDSGERVLECMAKQPFDVVVSDMRMPTMSGAALLNQIRDAYPRTTRVILSGQAEQEVIFRAFGPAQRYLSKPCEVKQLKEAIDRSVELQNLLPYEAFTTLLDDVKELRSLPPAIVETIRLVQLPQTSRDEIENRITNEPQLDEIFLSFANSPSNANPYNDLETAIAELPLELLRPFVLVAAAFSHVTKDVNPNLQERIDRSIRIASAARSSVQQDNDRQGHMDQVFVAGLLCELGALIVHQQLDADASNPLAPLADSAAILEAQHQCWGLNHHELSACLAQDWGLPHAIVEALALSNTNRFPAGPIPTPLDALRMALEAESLTSAS